MAVVGTYKSRRMIVLVMVSSVWLSLIFVWICLHFKGKRWEMALNWLYLDYTHVILIQYILVLVFSKETILISEVTFWVVEDGNNGS